MNLATPTIQPAYTTKRNDISNLIPDSAKTILDVGCCTGSLGRNVKAQRAVEITGIEYSAEAGAIAKDSLDRVIIGNLETLNLDNNLTRDYFDCIICGDILEHLRDPWTTVTNLLPFLKQDGVLLASIPNVRHYSTLLDLIVKGRWPYRSRGIHDKTHLRFFTRKNIQDLFDVARLEIQTIQPIYRLKESHHKINRYAKYVDLLPVGKDFFVFQYLIVGKKTNSLS